MAIGLLWFGIILLGIVVLAQFFGSRQKGGATPAPTDLGSRIDVLTERIANLETSQNKALTTSLDQAATDIASQIGRDLAAVQLELNAMNAAAKARQSMETDSAKSIERLETIIAGARSKGAAGENIVDTVFSKLPPEWQVRNFVVRGKTVEFGLRLPNGLVLPIDSKWAATNLLEQYNAAPTPAEQDRLRAEITRAVLLKAREVQKYIDPELTATFGIAVVPDAVYDLCYSNIGAAMQSNVVLVSYTMFVPYLLLVFQTTLKSSRSIDLERLSAHLEAARGSLQALQDELDGSFSRGLTILSNSRDKLRAQIGKASGSLMALEGNGTSSAPTNEQGELGMPEDGAR